MRKMKRKMSLVRRENVLQECRNVTKYMSEQNRLDICIWRKLKSCESERLPAVPTRFMTSSEGSLKLVWFVNSRKCSLAFLSEQT